MENQTKAELTETKLNARTRLTARIHPGQTVYTLQKRSSQSGLSRYLSVFVVWDNEIQDITWLVAKATGLTFKGGDCAIQVKGGGFCASQDIVENLSYALWKEPNKLAYRKL